MLNLGLCLTPTLSASNVLTLHKDKDKLIFPCLARPRSVVLGPSILSMFVENPQNASSV